MRRARNRGVRSLAGVVAALAFPAPAGAALQPGDRATIDVAVATLWKAPNLARTIDRPSLTNPVDLDAWNRNLSTTSSRLWLDTHVQTQALYAQTVTVLARRGGWAKVAVRDEPDPQDPHGYPGWLPASQLRAGYDEAGPSLLVVARSAVLHLDSGRAVELSYGTRLPVIRVDASGAKVVRSPDGAGTIAAASVAPSLDPSGASIVREAERFLGLRYLWGGLSAWGFDCSGLVWDVFRLHGMTIPRDADPQYRHGTPVARGSLRPGDLLFWGSAGYADHVAIYAGSGRMVEAPDSAHSVRVVPVRWDRYYLGARRYLSG